MKAILLVVLVLFTVLGFPTAALAHSVETNFSLTDKAQLELQVQFSTGEPFQMAPVQIYAPEQPNTPWMIGATDDQGKFAFQPDNKLTGDWKIRIGELNHADILRVPVTSQGVAIDQISEARPHRSQWIVLGFVASSALGTRFLFARRQRFWSV
ncbi:MAG TPA: hypothetical protein IGS37_15205 [Synechococcales cyanobacterium M55_K2018_004]|nr:hypothetical protein [Synechococcales cyanobacterium M55_K2018_004]